MTISLRVRNFRGAARAEIACDPVALCAGRNAAGKSSLAQAAGAVLTGETLPAGLATKAGAGRLVATGAAEASVEIADETGSARIAWPACQAASQGTPPQASRYAAGLASVADLSPKERARELARYLRADPTRDDLAAALDEAELGDALGAIWQLIEQQGWDAAHSLRRDLGVELKGRWRHLANHNWGARIGITWRPPGWSLDLDNMEDDAGLVAAVAEANRAHEAAIGAAAVGQARRAEMAAEADALEERKNVLYHAEVGVKTLAGELETARAARAQMPPGNIDTGLPCPHCGAYVVIRQVNLAETRLEPAETAITPTELKKRRAAVAAADGALSNLQGRLACARQTLDRARALMQQAAEAKNRLGQLPPAPAADSDVAAAKEALDLAERRLAAFSLLAEAEEIHRSIADNEKLLDLLAPTGLRAQKLARVVDAFNRVLTGLSTAAEWSPVTLDGELTLAYSGRPYALASTSEQYRVRAVLVVAMAQIDGSAMLVLDAADVLDGPTRSGLFALLDEAGLPALVTMTATRRDQVPDLAGAGLGQSFWLESGVALPLISKEAA